MSQGWKTLPATWLNASPVASRQLEQSNDGVDPEKLATDQPSSLCEARSQHNKLDKEDALPDAEAKIAAGVSGEASESLHLCVTGPSSSVMHQHCAP